MTQASLTISLGQPRPDELPVTISDMMQKVIMDEEFLPRERILTHPEGVDVYFEEQNIHSASQGEWLLSIAAAYAEAELYSTSPDLPMAESAPLRFSKMTEDDIAKIELWRPLMCHHSPERRNPAGD